MEARSYVLPYYEADSKQPRTLARSEGM